MKIQFKRMFSTDNPKAAKAAGLNYLNAINYLAPHESGGVGNLCSHASPGCIMLCLGEHSGQAAMSATVRDSRKRKAEYFMNDRKAFMAELCYHIDKLIAESDKNGLKLCVRLNGSTDIAFEGIRFDDGLNIFERYPAVQFVDYTKNPNRFLRKLPANYHLTFSLSEKNAAIAKQLLARNVNVAAVFGRALPSRYLGAPVINGDEHDLRHLDPQAGVIIGLTPKGHKAKRDESGFVIRNYQ